MMGEMRVVRTYILIEAQSGSGQSQSAHTLFPSTRWRTEGFMVVLFVPGICEASATPSLLS